ncbi:MAG: hypothetical protein GTO03_13410 [Planctomycetales bacterium]|nr:hypothetical protein [Planctomycetales bacterium]
MPRVPVVQDAPPRFRQIGSYSRLAVATPEQIGGHLKMKQPSHLETLSLASGGASRGGEILSNRPQGNGL